MVDETELASLRGDLCGTDALARLGAAEQLRRRGRAGWDVLVGVVMDASLDADSRVAASTGLVPEVPAAVVRPAAASLLGAGEPVLRSRGIIMCVRQGLADLIPQIEPLVADLSTFWEVDAHVSVSALAHRGIEILRDGGAAPDFPDWDSLAPPPRDPTGAENFAAMRAAFLALRRDQMPQSEADYPYEVFGVVMETGIEEGTFSLVCLADGTANLYLSDGGGTIGGGTHDSVQSTAIYLLAGAQHFYADAPQVTSFPTPAVGEVRIYFLTTTQGVRCGVAQDQELQSGGHPLSQLYDAGHQVIAAIYAIEDAEGEP